MPKRFGGEEWSPRQFCELIETLSKADGSVGWVASFGMSPAYLGSLPEETLKELYQKRARCRICRRYFPTSACRNYR